MERRKAGRLRKAGARATSTARGVWANTERKPVEYSQDPQQDQTKTGVGTEDTGHGPADGASLGSVRRRRSRGYAEMLVERAGWLPTADRALVEAVYGEGLTVIAFVRRCLDRGIAPVDRTALSITEGGDASGSLEAWTRVARRRLRRLVARLESDCPSWRRTHCCSRAVA